MAAIVRAVRLTATESIWYTLGCIWFGAMYLAKVPAKKALSEAGLARMTSAEQFWYVLQCVALGTGYLAKLPLKKALSEISHVPEPGYDAGDLALPPWGQQSRPRHGRSSEPARRLPPAPRHAQHDYRDQSW